MNIKQALKEKNKKAKKIIDLLDRTDKYNSMEEGGVRTYNPTESLEQSIETMEELITLKTRIHKANIEVYDNIFRMAEYKSFVKYLKNLNCEEGKITRTRFGDSASLNKTTIITERERDELVENYEKMIDDIQSELDEYNATTHI